MIGQVVIAAAPAGLFIVSPAPAISGQPAAHLAATFSEAVGIAVDLACASARTVIDETGRLCAAELEVLCVAYAAEIIADKLAFAAGSDAANPR